MNSNGFNEIPLIFSYTRTQAIEDGVLVDLTEWARETGFTIPVASTRAVWDRYIQPPVGTGELGQCERGRAHDLLWMLFTAIRRSKGGTEVLFKVWFIQSKKAKRPRPVELKAICGPGDNAEPVLTIMLPGED